MRVCGALRETMIQTLYTFNNQNIDKSQNNVNKYRKNWLILNWLSTRSTYMALKGPMRPCNTKPYGPVGPLGPLEGPLNPLDLYGPFVNPLLLRQLVDSLSTRCVFFVNSLLLCHSELNLKSTRFCACCNARFRAHKGKIGQPTK